MKENKDKKISIFMPPIWTLFPLYFISVAGVVAGSLLFLLDGVPEWAQAAAMGIFGVTFFVLLYTIIATVKLKKRIKAKVIKWSQKYSFANKFVTQYAFRTVIFAIGTLIVSFAFATFNAVIGMMTGSIWNGALAAYYFVLMTTRAVLVFWHRKKRRLIVKETDDDLKIGELKRYRACGILLIVLQAVFSVAIVQMVLSSKAFERTGLVIYVSAAYTVYKVVMAIYNTVKAHRNDDMTVRAIRSINLVDAFVSILALQTAMLREFRSEGLNTALMNGVMGAGVCAVAAILGIYMIVRANIMIRKVNAGQGDEVPAPMKREEEECSEETDGGAV